jgi:Flp pilus assembly protein TadG
MITAALVTFLLLGFVGMALDTGRLFVTKSELQTAMDSCALAAAGELDAQPDALTRAVNAGLDAGNQNRVGFQNASWGGLGQVNAAGITFRAADYTLTTVPAAARYAQCTHTHAGNPTWLLQALAAVTGDTAQYPATRTVWASAVATRGHTQTTCPLPIALRPKAGGTAPNYGYTKGEWITLLYGTTDSGAPGYIGWANLDGSNSASETTNELNGYCGVIVGTPLGTPGVQSTISDNWNWRFGIYKNSTGPTAQYAQPDLTGYAYTTTNWPSGANAYDGAVPAGAPAGARNFVNQRLNFANCINTATVGGQSVKNCEDLINRKLNGMQKLLPGTASGVDGHRRYGGNRRIVLVPVTLTYPGRVADYACMLMLQPLPIPKADVQLEYIGNASNPASPCTTSGLPGGTAGPLVPTLVR